MLKVERLPKHPIKSNDEKDNNVSTISQHKYI